MTYDEIKAQAEQAVRRRDVGEANRQWRELVSAHVDTNLKPVIISLQVLALPLLEPDEALAVFDVNLKELTLLKNIDIPDRLRRRLSLMPLEEREEFITRLKQQSDPANLEIIDQALQLRPRVYPTLTKGRASEGADVSNLVPPTIQPIATVDADKVLPVDQKLAVTRVDVKPTALAVGRNKLAQRQAWASSDIDATHAFSSQEASEVDWHRQQTARSVSEVDYDLVTDKIQSELNLNWPDVFLSKRFRQVVLAYIKDVRDVFETKDLLTRPIKVGGLELSQEQAEQILSQLRLLSPQTVASVKTIKTFAHQASVAIPQPSPEVKEIKPRPRPPQPSATASTTPLPTPPEPARQALATAPARLPVVRLSVETAATELPATPKVTTSSSGAYKLSVKPVATLGATRSVTDIQPASLSSHQPLSIVQEISTVSLTEVRNAPQGLNGILDRVRAEIETAAEESIIKKVQTIKAWRHSPLYQLYVKIGGRSLQSNLPVSEVIKNMGSPEQVLSPKEFDRIVEFNRALEV